MFGHQQNADSVRRWSFTVETASTDVTRNALDIRTSVYKRPLADPIAVKYSQVMSTGRRFFRRMMSWVVMSFRALTTADVIVRSHWTPPNVFLTRTSAAHHSLLSVPLRVSLRERLQSCRMLPSKTRTSFTRSTLGSASGSTRPGGTPTVPHPDHFTACAPPPAPESLGAPPSTPSTSPRHMGCRRLQRR